MTQEKCCPAYGESILDNYVVKLYARAYRDLDEICAYIAYPPRLKSYVFLTGIRKGHCPHVAANYAAIKNRP